MTDLGFTRACGYWGSTRDAGATHVTEDHYATLGVTSSSEQAVIHAAYRALMRRFHPDANPDGESGERVRAITAAYAVLRDPARRAEYDDARAVGDPLQALQMGEGAWPAQKRPPAARGIGLAAIAIAAVAVTAVWSLPRPDWRPAQPQAPSAQSEQPEQPEQPGETPSPQVPADGPAVQLASAPPTAAPRPPPAEPVAHRALEPAPAPPRRRPPAPQERAAAAAARADSAPKAATAAARRPAVPTVPATVPAACIGMQCTSERVAALDQHWVLLFNQSMSRADQAQSEQLRATRDGLLARRSACRSEECVAGAYLAHLREVGAIVESGAAPQR